MTVLLAEMSTESIVSICGVLLFFGKLIEKVYDRWQLKQAADKVAEKVAEVKTQAAENSEEVKTALKMSDAAKTAHLDRQDVKLKEIASEMSEVKVNTNGLVAKLEEKSKAEGFIDGVKSETDKAEKSHGNRT